MAIRANPPERLLRDGAEGLYAALVADADAAAAGRFARLAARVDGELEADEWELLARELEEDPMLPASLVELEELRAELLGPSAPARVIRFRPAQWTSYRRLVAAAAVAGVLVGGYFSIRPRLSRAPETRVAAVETTEPARQRETIFTGDFEDQSFSGWTVETGSPGRSEDR